MIASLVASLVVLPVLLRRFEDRRRLMRATAIPRPEPSRQISSSRSQQPVLFMNAAVTGRPRRGRPLAACVVRS